MLVHLIARINLMIVTTMKANILMQAAAYGAACVLMHAGLSQPVGLDQACGLGPLVLATTIDAAKCVNHWIIARDILFMSFKFLSYRNTTSAITYSTS
jgi:hypothetical protein